MLQKLLIALALSLLVALPGIAAEPVNADFWAKTAIGGKDTVSYHSPNVKATHKVETGDKAHEVVYLGATWRFASKESADRFAASPAAYVPQYNGFCANALSSGEGLVKTDGNVWDFFGDKLYLFYADGGRQRWLRGDWQKFKIQADTAWKAAATQ